MNICAQRFTTALLGGLLALTNLGCAAKAASQSSSPTSTMSASLAPTMTAAQIAANLATMTSTRFAAAQSVGLPERWPLLLAGYQAWFGVPGHADIGYSSVDRVVLEKQVEKAREMGISGFVINWYGPSKDFEDRAYSLLQEIASRHDFKVALMYDEDTGDKEQATQAAIADLQYAYTRYIGPTASYPRTSYLTYQGRPVIFIFPKTGRTDWKQVRESMNSWEQKPVLIYKDNHGAYANDFDGYYAWVNPGTKGWAKDGSNWGQEYLEGFYQQMTAKHPDKVIVGAAWPGFNDTKASWSQNRKMDGRCGKTFDDSLRAFRRYFSDAKPLPFLMINTWNDYEEGTAIERGIDRCNGQAADGKQ